jgi:4-aminobutyrate aminotransferase/(S)-3-amino-2-methylpropionate transaminase
MAMATNAELLQRRGTAVPRGITHATPVFAAHAENSEIWDVEGKRYIDFVGGIGTLNVGHRHPEIVAAAKAQLALFTHTAVQIMPYGLYIALAERLNALAPFKGPAKTMLLSTGSEAVESAVKIARVATGRPGLIAFTGGFHGRTNLTTALTGRVSPYKKKFGTAPADIYHIPFPIEHQGVTVSVSLQALDFLFKADIEPERVAAIIIEPVQGEGGFYIAPTELLVELRRICDMHGILFIADEVQSGFARTGRMFAVEHSGVEPDLITIAKSLGGGFPLSGIIGRADVMDAAEPGTLGGTYAGNPIACAAALAVLDVIEKERLLDRAMAIGARLKVRLEKMDQRNDAVPIAAIRGLGAMVGFEIVKGRGGHEPNPEMTRAVVSRALAGGLILLPCGNHGNVIRVLVPLTVSDTVLDEGIDKLEQALTI